jgi:hypothetical protein
MWIVQEIVMARELFLHCGDSKASWSDFKIVVDTNSMVDTLGETFRIEPPPRNVVSIFREKESSEQDTAIRSLTHVIQTFGAFERQNVRGKIQPPFRDPHNLNPRCMSNLSSPSRSGSHYHSSRSIAWEVYHDRLPISFCLW